MKKSLDGPTEILFNKIRQTKHGILYHSGTEFIINPETVKNVLQERIENSKVDLLFHIVPFYVKQKENNLELSVTGKEGIFKIKGKNIIDFSEEFDLLKLENVNRNLKEIYFNLFLTGLKSGQWQSFEYLNKFIKLDDNRYWVSLTIPKLENNFFIENNSQKILNEFEEVVQKSGGRVQLVAPQSQKNYQVDKFKISEKIFHIKSKLSNTFSSHEIIKEMNELIVKQ